MDSRKCQTSTATPPEAGGLPCLASARSLQRSLRSIYSRLFVNQFSIREGYCFSDCRYGTQFLCHLSMGAPMLDQGLIPTEGPVPSAKMLKNGGLPLNIPMANLALGIAHEGVTQTLPSGDLSNRTLGPSDHSSRMVRPVVPTEHAIQVVLGWKAAKLCSVFVSVHAEESNIHRIRVVLARQYGAFSRELSFESVGAGAIINPSHSPAFFVALGSENGVQADVKCIACVFRKFSRHKERCCRELNCRIHLVPIQ